MACFLLLLGDSYFIAPVYSITTLLNKNVEVLEAISPQFFVYGTITQPTLMDGSTALRKKMDGLIRQFIPHRQQTASCPARIVQPAAAAAVVPMFTTASGICHLLEKVQTVDVKRDAAVGVAQANRDAGIRKAEAQLAYELQAAKTRQKIRTEEMQITVVERRKQIEIEEQEIMRREKELIATVRLPAEAESFKVELVAQGQSHRESFKKYKRDDLFTTLSRMLKMRYQRTKTFRSPCMRQMHRAGSRWCWFTYQMEMVCGRMQVAIMDGLNHFVTYIVQSPVKPGWLAGPAAKMLMAAFTF
ncbi:hypothetical protein DAPPUDRAFT_239186 [Daphnia pulex]|uniref:Band 7 domain-containing protein n=1 Tax=Daphnia pulex TaxID=6669 RepID=E9G8K7_DAPPU|nr:hypothetical protein DAPPUDRAFT_239186 [Daphnia pulex]|eukprot:EFX84252.1 hypothetical protein DAPPUDRAFT_239186 [Daphnia pulex]